QFNADRLKCLGCLARQLVAEGGQSRRTAVEQKDPGVLRLELAVLVAQRLGSQLADLAGAQGGEGGQCLVRGGRRRPKRKFRVVRGLNNLGYSERFACKLVGLDRSTYYGIKFPRPNDREIRRLLLADAIAGIHARSRGTYGACGSGPPWRSSRG